MLLHRSACLLILVGAACGGSTSPDPAKGAIPGAGGDTAGAAGDPGAAGSWDGGRETGGTETGNLIDSADNAACPLGNCTPAGQRVAPLPKVSCPHEEPMLGSACNEEALECSYGDSVTAYCRRYYQCSDRLWLLPSKWKDSCVVASIGSCPAQPNQGMACTVGDVDVFVPCEYPGGIACYCLGDRPWVVGSPGEWDCYGPPRNGSCPELLPNLGDGCTKTGLTCSYGIVEQGCHAPYANVYCYQGAWEMASATCLL